ncbi:hypothetical protein FQA47_002288 [Oryzias melastigma]|uniref:Uncharacterized protein n=1 Tax=Oryzias melastigma TaxID=30732 RepID=A0A834BVS5_ORYME|nr:hypothetical protein FQA47_002288 [Oryzias melastigma]
MNLERWFVNPTTKKPSTASSETWTRTGATAWISASSSSWCVVSPRCATSTSPARSESATARTAVEGQQIKIQPHCDGKLNKSLLDSVVMATTSLSSGVHIRTLHVSQQALQEGN